MYLEDLNCFNNKALIAKFYKESQGKEAMSAKNIRHWLSKPTPQRASLFVQS